MGTTPITMAELGLSPHLTTGLPVALLVLTTIAIGLRVYVRGFMIKAFGWDDWLIVLAYLIFLADSAINIEVGHVLATRGFGQDIMVLSKMGVVIYLINQVVIKWSLAIFFGRIVKEPWKRNVMRGMCTAYTMLTIIFIVVTAHRCSNMRAGSIVVGQCLAHDHVLRPLNYMAATMNCVTDWVFALIPAFVISTVQIPTKAKMMVYILISLGCISSVVSIVRISYIPSSHLGKDYIRKNLIIAMLSLSESGVAITAISLATLRPLLRASLDKTRKFLTSNSTPQNASETRGIRGKHEQLGSEMEMHDTTKKTETVVVIQERNSGDIVKDIEQHQVSSMV